MPKEFENPEEEKIVDETATNETQHERIERVAEKAAEKASQTQKHFDQDHQIFSK